MEYGYSILMFCLSGALVLYAGVLALFKDPSMIRRPYAAKMKNPQDYAVQFAKVIALVALSPLLSGLAGLFFKGVFAGIVLIVSFILLIRRGIPLMDDVTDYSANESDE